ncbi:hypothetical protein ACWGJB_39515 [Streptomyces sp. NPDC054813]
MASAGGEHGSVEAHGVRRVVLGGVPAVMAVLKVPAFLGVPVTTPVRVSMALVRPMPATSRPS